MEIKSLQKQKKFDKVSSELLIIEKRWLVEPFEEDGMFVPPPRVSGKCTGCEYCEAICSFTHFGIVSPALAAIHVSKTENDWVHGKAPMIFERFVCKQCPGISPCMAVCPMLDEGALFRDPETKAVLLNHDVCTRCSRCVEACPYDAIKYSPRMKKMIKCDLCDGKPKCVQWCQPQVLRYVKK